MFAFSHITAAQRAGIFDMIPVDDEEGYRQSGALPDAAYLLGRTIEWFCQDPKGGLAQYNDEAIERIETDYLRIKKIVDKRLEHIEMEREKAMCRNVMENYIPGSALLCGIGHLKPLQERLSKRFALRIYKVGEKLFASLGQSFQ